MKTLSSQISKYKHFSSLLVFILLQLWFVYLERTIKPQHYMFSPLDMKIPFVKEFVIPYLFWYIYMSAALLYLGLVSKKDYYKLYAMMALGMATALIIYTLFPNGQNLRPNVLGSDIFSKVIRFIYMVDTPTNVAPSLHVYDSMVVHMALVSSAPLKDNRRLKNASLICMISIIASTMFIKQHSVQDVIWGALMAFAFYGIIYSMSRSVLFQEGRGKRADAVSH